MNDDKTATNFTERVIGTDDRSEVSPANVSPWPAICALRITAANGERLDGTGFLIGPSAVLTVGHNVFDRVRGGRAREIRVIPSQTTGAPFGDVFSSTYRIATGWEVSGVAERDYGAILLSRPVGNLAGLIRCRVLADGPLSVSTLTVAGYPTDKGSSLLVRADGMAALVALGLLSYQIDTNEGQSGCPILLSVNGTLNAVGIHGSGNSAINQGVRITGPVFADIQTWMTEGA